MLELTQRGVVSPDSAQRARDGSAKPDSLTDLQCAQMVIECGGRFFQVPVNVPDVVQQPTDLLFIVELLPDTERLLKVLQSLFVSLGGEIGGRDVVERVCDMS